MRCLLAPPAALFPRLSPPPGMSAWPFGLAPSGAGRSRLAFSSPSFAPFAGAGLRPTVAAMAVLAPEGRAGGGSHGVTEARSARQSTAIFRETFAPARRLCYVG